MTLRYPEINTCSAWTLVSLWGFCTLNDDDDDGTWHKYCENWYSSGVSTPLSSILSWSGKARRGTLSGPTAHGQELPITGANNWREVNRGESSVSDPRGEDVHYISYKLMTNSHHPRLLPFSDGLLFKEAPPNILLLHIITFTSFVGLVYSFCHRLLALNCNPLLFQRNPLLLVE